jgi:hypothetical protein
MKINVFSNVIPYSLVDINQTAFGLRGVAYQKVLRCTSDLIY